MLVDASGQPYRSRKKRPPGLTVFFSASQIEALTSWDTPNAKAAMAAHEMGDFELSGRAYWAMKSDSRVDDGAGKRALALRGVPYEIRPGRGRGAVQLARVLRRAFGFTDRGPTGPNLVTPPETVTELFSQALLMGQAVAQPEWENEDQPELNNNGGAGWFLPTLKSWEPTLTRWQQSMLQDDPNGGQLVARVYGSEKKPGEFGDVPVVPGTGEWMLFTLAGDRRPWMHGKMRAIWRPWISRLMKMLFWLRFDEVHGLPFRVLSIPHGMKRTPETKATFDALKKVGREATFQTPQAPDGKSGVKVDLIEAKSESWKSFEAGLVHYGTEITILLTGGTMTTEALGGNYEGAKQQQEIRHEVKAADAQAWATCVNRQICTPFATLNGFLPAAAPEVVYDTRPPVNKKASAEASAAEFKAVQEACKAHAALESRGIVVPLIDFLAERGLTLPTGTQVKPPPARRPGRATLSREEPPAAP